jgi:rare lipoprotein A
MTVLYFLKKTLSLTAILFCIFSITGISLAFGDQSEETVQSLKVTAGWYGKKHNKKLTANGNRFNMNKNTLAHKTLPFGTKVRLVNFDNKKSAIGVVNDRGPYKKGRDLDVSYSMAKQLGFVKKGVVQLYLSKLEDQDQDPQN